VPEHNSLIRLTLLGSLLIQPGALPAGNIQDPMRPPNFNADSTTQAASVPQWNLTEILISDERRIAIINNKPVKAGDMINNAKVISINTDHVVLTRHNKTFKQYLSRIPVKQQTLPGTESTYE
jgi:hypothetical protein